LSTSNFYFTKHNDIPLKEVLDDFNYKDHDPNKVRKIVIRNAIITALIFIVFYFLKIHLTENLTESEGVNAFLIGIMLFISISLVIRFTISTVHKIDNKKKSITLALLGSTSFVLGDLIYRLFLSFVILGSGLYFSLTRFIVGIVVFGLYSFFYGYVQASKLRKENTIIPNLLLIGYFLMLIFIGGYLFR